MTRRTVLAGQPAELAIAVCGLLAFILSLIPSYYVFKGEIHAPSFGGDQTRTANVNAWHGFFGWFGAVCALAGAVILVLWLVRVLRSEARIIMLGTAIAFGLAALCTIVAGFSVAGAPSGYREGSINLQGISGEESSHHGVPYWICLILILIGLALALLRALGRDPRTLFEATP